MIYLFLNKQKYKSGLMHLLAANGIECVYLSAQKPESLAILYSEQANLSGLVVESQHPHLPQHAWLDLLLSLSGRLPLVVISDEKGKESSSLAIQAPQLILLHQPELAEIIEALAAAGCLKLRKHTHTPRELGFFNPALAIRKLEQQGSVSLLNIQAEEFHSIATEYGAEDYHKLQNYFQQTLLELWGAPQSFRKGDLLCRISQHSNSYYILLDQSRSQLNLPAPGALERLADRIATQLQNRLWKELLKLGPDKQLPSYLHTMPRFAIGQASGIYNPCVASEEILERTLNASREDAKVQKHRINCRQKEFLQALIHSHNTLIPHFQGIFYIADLTTENVTEAVQSRSLDPLADSLYGFESLIRINNKQIALLLNQTGPLHLHTDYLNPSVLFSLANQSKLSLELDQVCLKLAAQHFSMNGLPGRLLANILPRNFYYIEQLQHLIPDGSPLTLEVSESEAISNFGLLIKSKEYLAKKSYEIAIDDFGKGYASLDRIINIRPHLIKLDRSLIENIHQDPTKKAFTSGIINAAKLIHATVLAEGIETLEEFELLKSLGVDLVQGFLFHRPQSAASLRKDLDAASLQSYKPVA